MEEEETLADYIIRKLQLIVRCMVKCVPFMSTNLLEH